MKEGKKAGDYVEILHAELLKGLDPHVTHDAQIALLASLENAKQPEEKLDIIGQRAASFFGTNTAHFINVDLTNGIWSAEHISSTARWLKADGIPDIHRFSGEFNDMAAELIRDESVFIVRISRLKEDFADDYGFLKSIFIEDALCAAYNGVRRGFFVILNRTANLDYAAFISMYMNHALGHMQMIWVRQIAPSAMRSIFDESAEKTVFPTLKSLDADDTKVHAGNGSSSEDRTGFFTPNSKIDFSGVKVEDFLQDEVDFDTFCKSDFRAVKVKECIAVPKSKKLLQHFS